MEKDPHDQSPCPQVEQTILNLALNARDAMPKGGILQIETNRVDLLEGQIRRAAELDVAEGINGCSLTSPELSFTHGHRHRSRETRTRLI